MFTPKNVAVVLILVFIVSLASWSKLRFVDESDHEEQRWRIEDYPGFTEKKSAATGYTDIEHSSQ
ncbi:MAG: hypothetical protein AB2563_04100 [Candidatus Thiodiazotropha endolucinida]